VEIRKVVSNALVERGGIHYLEGHADFNYNDGNQMEASLLQALRNSTDLSSGSRELEARARDWVSWYHLARARSLAYRSLEIPADASVLEVGSGTGSISRLLGEKAGAVLALEGSPRRAALTRERTRDQANVSVLCGSFELVKFERKFDVVVCNGVLEYASMFISGQRPAERMLGMLSGLLQPGGTLVIAIENKLGLRYFSSSREEHTNVRFDGLEGYPRHPGGPRTFGRGELGGLLSEHFASVEFLLPLPDYKFPQAVIREALLDEVDCAEMFGSLGSGRSGAAERPLLHERLAWHELGRNGLLREFANSFIAVASQSPSPLLPPGWMGDIHAIKRAPGLEVRTSIKRDGDGAIVTEKNYIPGLKPAGSDRFSHRLETLPWIGGESIHTVLSRAMLRGPGVSLEQRLRPAVSLWWQALQERPEHAEGRRGISGESLDLNWENSILEDSEVRFIDGEWVLHGQVDADWMLYRALTKFVNTEWNFRHRWDRSCRGASKLTLFRTLGSITDVRCSLRSMWKAIGQEAQLQRFATGGGRSPLHVLAEDCLPFWFVFHWGEAMQWARRFAGRIKRNLRRVLSRQ